MDNKAKVHHEKFQELQAAAERDQLSHALLLYGPQGNASLSLALQLTTLIMCPNTENGQACGQCPSCVKLSKYIHPDVHFVYPVISEKGKEIYKDWYPEWRAALTENPYLGYFQWISALSAENKQGNISAKACNELIRDLTMKAYVGDKKIGIIWMPEYLGKEGNRLLKLIEEPPDNTYLFLITSDVEKILPTIISRCRQIYVPPFTDEEVTSLLISRKGLTQEQAAKIAMLSEGDWNKASEMASKGDARALDLLKLWIKAAWSAKADAMTEGSNQLQAMSKEEQKQFMEYFLQFLQKLLWRLAGLKAESEYDEEKAVLDFLVSRTQLAPLDSLRLLIEENLESMRYNPNGRIMWMHATLALRNALHSEKLNKQFSHQAAINK